MKESICTQYKKILNILRLNSETPNWLEYVLVFFMFGIGMLVYEYFDFKSLTVWSVSLIDCVVDGNLYDFYAVVHENIHGAPHPYCGYNYIILIPWAIWNIPIWIMQRFWGMEVLEHTGMLIWSRMFLLLMLGVILFFSKKIIEYFVEDKRVMAWSTYLIVAFPFTFISIIIAGQSDVIVMAITIIAVYFLLQNKQWIFLLLMAVSISAKPFFIFAYIAMILLIEKNIIKSGLKIASSAVIMLLFNWIYANAPMYTTSIENGTGNSIILKMFSSGVNALGGAQISFLVIGLFFLYFIAYCIPYNPDKKEKKYYIIYMSAAPMLVYMASAGFEFYRLFYVIPFLVILMAMNVKMWRMNLILEKILSVMSVFMVLYGLYTIYLPCLNIGIFQRLGWDTNISSRKYGSASELLVAKFGEWFPTARTLAGSLIVAVIITMLFINLPIVSRRLPQPKIKCERWLYWVDIVVIAAFLGILLMLCFNMFS